MSDPSLFVRRLVHRWGRLLTGGVLVALVTVGEHVSGKPVPPWAYASASGLAVLYAAFYVWKEEKERGDRLGRELDEAHAADAGAVMRQISDPFFWLLSVIQRHGARRESVQGIGESISGAWWIGETAVSINRSNWLYALLDSAVGRGFLIPEGNPPQFVAPPPVERSLEADRRRKRAVNTPEEKIFDPRFEEPVRLDF